MTKMLRGKTVRIVRRHRRQEVMIEFEDETRLYVDWKPEEELEFSITGNYTES